MERRFGVWRRADWKGKLYFERRGRVRRHGLLSECEKWQILERQDKWTVSIGNWIEFFEQMALFITPSLRVLFISVRKELPANSGAKDCEDFAMCGTCPDFLPPDGKISATSVYTSARHIPNRNALKNEAHLIPSRQGKASRSIGSPNLWMPLPGRLMNAFSGCMCMNHRAQYINISNKSTEIDYVPGMYTRGDSGINGSGTARGMNPRGRVIEHFFGNTPEKK